MARTPEQAACHVVWMRAFTRRNKDRINREKRERYANDPEYRECRAKYAKKYRDADPEAYAILQAIDYQKHKDKRKAWEKRDRAENPAKYKARAGAAKARRKKRAVAWADKDALSFFYECCPAGCDVDHIIPMQGKLISGLHVPENLQWLPSLANNRKNNTWNST